MNSTLADYYDPVVLSASDYFPFGMEMPGRTMASNGYRYGFNGKEKDTEGEWGTQTHYDYGFRIYEPAIGRFLSVDPLMKEYPWNSTYAFAENDVIRSIDLEGAEKLNVTITGKPTPSGVPGTAKITVELDYVVVTKGPGAVGNHGLINPANVKKLYANGNTSFRMSSLPTKASPGKFLSKKHNRWARKAEKGSAKHQLKLQNASVHYYIVDVEYHYTVTKGTDLATAAKWMDVDKQSRGIIMSPLSKMDAKKLAGVPNFADIYFGSRFARKALSPVEGGMGLNDKQGTTTNIIYTNPIHFGVGATYSFPLSADEVIAHEAGHNSAKSNVHGTGSYEYNQTGLQSNQPGNVYPTKANTKAIINDKANRQSINK